MLANFHAHLLRMLLDLAISGYIDKFYQDIQYSPAFGFGNAITILSGKVLANNKNGLLILSSLSL